MIYTITKPETYSDYLKLIGDASPKSETHWTRCRGGQRIYARAILGQYDRERKARRGEIKHSLGCILLFTLLVILLAMVFAGGCADAPKPEQNGHAFKRMQLIGVEGDSSDQWEIWRDTETNTQILCHHSGSTIAYGGRSTSCVVVSR